MYSHNNRTSKYKKQRPEERKNEIDKFTIIFGNFSAPPLGIDRPT